MKALACATLGLAMAGSGCSPASTPVFTRDAADDVPNDAGLPPALFDSNPKCWPQSLDRFSPKPYRPPVAGGVCTESNITSYVDCMIKRSRPACDALFDTEGNFVPTFRACGPCVETLESADRWGAVVITNAQTGDGFNNVAGCLGTLAGDGPSATGCGAAAHALQQCWAAACPESVCPLGDPARGDLQTRPQLAAYGVCVREASKGACGAYDAVFADRCASILGDAATSRCGGGPDADPAQHLAALLTVICGGAPADAGDGG
jgi:hypothetical protein